MSIELANENGLLGQVASNQGYLDLIDACEKDEVLSDFFFRGVTEEVEEIRTHLAEVGGSEDIKHTAKAFADLMKDQDLIIISGGIDGDEEISKRISGNSPISINAKGKALAEKLGQRIFLKGGLDVLYSSTLNRGKQTAAAIKSEDPKVKLAEPTPDLCPWHLGEFEGKMPDDVGDMIDYFIENPDKRPPGKGADGSEAETFNEAKTRQLNFYKKIYQDSVDHPNLKIGIITHSRSQELLQAWVDDGCPEDFDVKLKDLEHPDDPDHVDMLRWHNNKIKEVDVDEDDELKPGVYTILHSLTDDDTDEGNKELQKMQRPPHLRTTTTAHRCSNCDYFDPAGHCKMYGGYPVEADQVCDEWVGKSQRAEKRGDPERLYLPPVEVQKAAKEAWDAGQSVPGITSALAEYTGLRIDEIQKVSEFFLAVEVGSIIPSEVVKKAWGGWMASKWADRVLKKAGKDWPEWIGYDLDGTLAEKTDDLKTIGEPREKEVARAKKDLEEGRTVKIFTARVADDPDGEQKKLIEAWCEKVFGKVLPVTNEKDPGMIRVVDDLAVPLAKAGNGVMLALWPDSETQKEFAVEGGEKADDLHITLAYFGKLDVVPTEALPKIESAVQQFATTHGPLTVVLGGIGRFPATPNSDGKDVAYLGVHSSDALKFREELVSGIEALGVEPKKDFNWNPHVSLKFVPPHAPHLISTPEPKEITFNEIVLSIGSAKKVYPLTGVSKWNDEDEPNSEDRPDEEDRSATEDRYEDYGKVELRADIIKLDGAKQMVFGWFSIVAVGGREIEDVQGDIISSETIEESAYDFVLTSRKNGEMHEPGEDGQIRGVGRLIESVVFTREKQEAMVKSLADQGITANIDLNCEAWWGGFKVDDPKTWEKVTLGELQAFSIGGRGKREKVAR